MKLVIQVISLCFFLLLCTNAAFAQDAEPQNSHVVLNTTTNTVENTAEPNYENYEFYKETLMDMQRESKLYKGFGWGLFGTGLAMGIAGITVMLYYGFEYNDKKNKIDSIGESKPINKNYYDVRVNTGDALTGIGTLFTLTGIALLIAEAVKFAPLRNTQIAGDFIFHPEFYMTPEMSGIGISGHF